MRCVKAMVMRRPVGITSETHAEFSDSDVIKPGGGLELSISSFQKNISQHFHIWVPKNRFLGPDWKLTEAIGNIQWSLGWTLPTTMKVLGWEFHSNLREMGPSVLLNFNDSNGFDPFEKFHPSVTKSFFSSVYCWQLPSKLMKAWHQCEPLPCFCADGGALQLDTNVW